MPGDDPLALGRAALERAAWDDARAHYERASEAGGGAAWEGVSWAAWWQGDLDATFAARERAFRAYREAGDPCGAARMADVAGIGPLRLPRRRRRRRARGCAGAEDLGGASRPAPSTATTCSWRRPRALRARRSRHRAGQGGGGDRGGQGRRGRRRRGRGQRGPGQCARRPRRRGGRAARLDACAALAIAEDFDLIVAPGWALCHTVSVCTNVGDFGRAGQWCRALHTWSARWNGRHFFGICRTAYGDVLATRGDWGDGRGGAVQRAQGHEHHAARRWPRRRRCGWAGCARRRAIARVRASCTSRRSRCPAPSSPSASWTLEAGDPSAGVDAADRVLRNARRGEPRSTASRRSSSRRGRAHARATHDGAAAVAEQLERDAARLAHAATCAGAAGSCAAEVLPRRGDHDGARRAAEDAADLFAACAAPVRRGPRAARARRGARRRSAARTALPPRLARRARRSPACARPAATTRAARRSAPSEPEILRLVAEGLADPQIAGAPVPQPAHGAPPRREHPREAPHAVARRRRRATPPSAACSSWPDGRTGHRAGWPQRAKARPPRAASVAPMTDITIASSADELRFRLDGGVHEPGGPAYDDACTLFNTMIERRPLLVVRAARRRRRRRRPRLRPRARPAGRRPRRRPLRRRPLAVRRRRRPRPAGYARSRSTPPGGSPAWRRRHLGRPRPRDVEHGLATTGGRVSRPASPA